MVDFASCLALKNSQPSASGLFPLDGGVPFLKRLHLDLVFCYVMQQNSKLVGYLGCFVEITFDTGFLFRPFLRRSQVCGQTLYFYLSHLRFLTSSF